MKDKISFKLQFCFEKNCIALITYCFSNLYVWKAFTLFRKNHWSLYNVTITWNDVLRCNYLKKSWIVWKKWDATILKSRILVYLGRGSFWTLTTSHQVIITPADDLVQFGKEWLKSINTLTIYGRVLTSFGDDPRTSAVPYPNKIKREAS